MHSFRKRTTKRDRHGFTLIEVLVGSVLLVFLLGAFVRIAGTLREQRIGADRTERAALAVDRLLSDWSIQGKDGVPLSGSGQLPGEQDLYWTIESIDASGPTNALYTVVRLTVFYRSVVEPTASKPILTLHLLRMMPS